MEKIRNFLRDAALALVLGAGIGIVLVLVFGVLGALFGGLQGALEASRSSVLLCGGLLLIYSAILMLKGGNLPPDAFTLQPHKKQNTEDFDSVEPLKLFRLLPRQYAYALMAAGILTASLLPESVVLYYL